MTKPGTIQTCSVLEKKEPFYTLTCADTTIRMPVEEASFSLEAGNEVEVFIYTDKQGTPLATMRRPEATSDTYGWGEVVEIIQNLGVFIDAGLPEELLVPKDDLPFMEKVWPAPADLLYVILTQDKQGRLLARPAKEDTILSLSHTARDEMLNQKVKARVYRSAKVGSFLWTEGRVRAFLHHKERTQEPRMGEEIEVRVIDVKEDGTINVSQRPDRLESMDQDSHAILLQLSRNRGEMPFSDKSDPEAIQETFHISKGAFKRAVGRLLKQGLIEQTNEGTIRIKDTNDK